MLQLKKHLLEVVVGKDQKMAVRIAKNTRIPGSVAYQSHLPEAGPWRKDRNLNVSWFSFLFLFRIFGNPHRYLPFEYDIEVLRSWVNSENYLIFWYKQVVSYLADLVDDLSVVLVVVLGNELVLWKEAF